MIRVNLLPARPKPFRISAYQLGLLSLSCLLILSVFLLHIHFQKEIHQLNLVKNEKQTELRQKQKELAWKRKQAMICKKRQEQLQILRSLQLAHFSPTGLFEAVVNSVGSARISFESLVLTANGTLNLEGMALDVQTLAAYIRRLRQQAEIQDVKAIQTTTREVQDFAFLHFSCQIIAQKQESS